MGKEITIKNYDMFQAYQTPEDLGKCMRILGDDFLQVSDGYHTFDELYDHRITLYIALCSHVCERGVLKVWRSKKHSDGELAFGGTWFVLGINKEVGKQITYHLPIHKWDECAFAEELETAPEWDGHTSADVLERLKGL